MHPKANMINAMIYLVITIFCLGCLIPFLLIISISLTDQEVLIVGGYKLWPGKFTLMTYEILFSNFGSVLESYKTTIIVTFFGTVLSLFLTLLVSYAISRKNFKYRNVISFYIFFTMLFNGGIVPWFLLCRGLKLYDNIFALIIPYLLQPWNIFLLKNFMSAIPDSIEESAKIDGAKDLKILFTIMAPLALPGIATVGLFYTLMYWNDWWLGLMLIDRSNLVPIQFYLLKLLNTIEFFHKNTRVKYDKVLFPNQGVRMAIALAAIGPIVFAYPFFQKYFTRGLIIGAIKG